MNQSRLKNYIIKSPTASMVLFSAASFLLAIFFCFLGYYFGFFTISNGTVKALRLSQTSYPLIDPLLLCNVDQKDFNEDKTLDKIINNFVSDRVSKGLAENMSVYFLNYSSGKWVGVNENDRYDPASMLKVPVMIAYFKNAETDPGILSQQTSFQGDDQNTGEFFRSNNDIKPGQMYTIDELIKSMIINSDNTADALLENYIDKNSLYDVYTDLGLPVPATAPNVQYMSAKLYAYFFRILYNGTYLDHRYSEQALEYLSEVSVPGIKDGVPSGTTVAQKFGERSVFDQNGNLQDREFHDCGIVYKPGNPYLLCVMSRGKDFNTLAKNISDLSALVYANIDR